MKKLSKILLYLSLCATFSASTFSSVSAVKEKPTVHTDAEETQFSMDEELAEQHEPLPVKAYEPTTWESGESHDSGSDSQSSASSSSSSSGSSDDSSSEESVYGREIQLETRSLPDLSVMRLMPILETEKTMASKKMEFYKRYILICDEFKFNTKYQSRCSKSEIKMSEKMMSEWRHDISDYLRILLRQSQEHPGTITHKQICDFFFSIARIANPTYSTNTVASECIIRFDTMYNKAGCIVCTPVGNPYYILGMI